jgi:DNA repair protein RadC
MRKAHDSAGTYDIEAMSDNEILARAEEIMLKRFRRLGSIGNPRDSGDYLRARLAHLDHERFVGLWLDNRHQIIACECHATGTIDGASVHPREIVRAALKHNAAAVIFGHNHPSGVAEPSAADRAITRELIDALKLVGVRVLDHLVIGSGEPTSMAARGLM